MSLNRGNPTGRRKQTEEEKAFKALAQSRSVQCLEEVIQIAVCPASSVRDKLKACEMVMDRAWGKPGQQLDVEASVAHMADELINRPPRLTRDEWLRQYGNKKQNTNGVH
jgi:hypothetical protein